MPEEKHRKHTPITSEAQRGLLGADLARLRAGKKTKTGMSEEQLVAHLEEAGGKELPERKSLEEIVKSIDNFLAKQEGILKK